MKFSKAELAVLNMLWAAHYPMSIMELSERSSFRFIPYFRVTMAVERLVQKGAIIEAGIHQSYSTGKAKSYIAYAPVIHPEELTETKNLSHRETQFFLKEGRR